MFHDDCISLLELPNKISKSRCLIPGVPKLWDLMPNDLRWSWCNSNRSKVHNKCNVLESSPNHPPPQGPWKNCLPWNQSPVPKDWGPLAYTTEIYFITDLETWKAKVKVPQGWCLPRAPRLGCRQLPFAVNTQGKQTLFLIRVSMSFPFITLFNLNCFSL